MDQSDESIAQVGFVRIMPLNLEWFDAFLEQHPDGAVVEHEKILRSFENGIPRKEQKNERHPCEVHLAILNSFDRPNKREAECERHYKARSKECGVWSR